MSEEYFNGYIKIKDNKESLERAITHITRGILYRIFEIIEYGDIINKISISFIQEDDDDVDDWVDDYYMSVLRDTKEIEVKIYHEGFTDIFNKFRDNLMIILTSLDISMDIKAKNKCYVIEVYPNKGVNE
jgi:hypothetical protein